MATLEAHKQEIRGCLLSCKEGVPLTRFQADYRSLVGENVPFQRFGYRTLLELFEDIPDVARLQRSNYGSDTMVFGVADQSTKHIDDLIKKQKSNTSRRSRGGGGGRSRGGGANRYGGSGRPTPGRNTYSTGRPGVSQSWNPSRYAPQPPAPIRSPQPPVQPQRAPPNAVQPQRPAQNAVQSQRSPLNAVQHQYTRQTPTPPLRSTSRTDQTIRLHNPNQQLKNIQQALNDCNRPDSNLSNISTRIEWLTSDETFQNGVNIVNFKQLYDVRFQANLNIEKYGFSSMEQFLERLPTVELKMVGQQVIVYGVRQGESDTSRPRSSLLKAYERRNSSPSSVSNIAMAASKPKRTMRDLEPYEIESLLLEFLENYPDGIPLRSFEDDFKKHTGIELDLDFLGYYDVSELTEAQPEIFYGYPSLTGFRVSHLKYKNKIVENSPLVKKDTNSSHESSQVPPAQMMDIPDTVVNNMTRLLRRHSRGIAMTKLEEFYASYFKSPLPFKELGYLTVPKFLLALSKLMDIEKLRGENNSSIVRLRMAPIYKNPEPAQANAYPVVASPIQTTPRPPSSASYELPVSPIVRLTSEFLEDTVTTVVELLEFDLLAFTERNEYFAVLVSQIQNPGEIYIQLQTRKEELDDLMDDLEAVYAGIEGDLYKIPTDFQLFVDLLCVALFTDRNWHRVIIVEIINDIKYKVFYIDYGGCCTVEIQNLRLMKKTFLRSPRLAVRAFLSAIKPFNNTEKWSPDATRRLRSLTAHRVIQAMIYETTESHGYGLLLCDTGCSSSQDYHISDILVEENLVDVLPTALFIDDDDDDEEVEELCTLNYEENDLNPEPEISVEPQLYASSESSTNSDAPVINNNYNQRIIERLEQLHSFPEHFFLQNAECEAAAPTIESPKIINKESSYETIDNEPLAEQTTEFLRRDEHQELSAVAAASTKASELPPGLSKPFRTMPPASEDSSQILISTDLVLGKYTKPFRYDAYEVTLINHGKTLHMSKKDISAFACGGFEVIFDYTMTSKNISVVSKTISKENFPHLFLDLFKNGVVEQEETDLVVITLESCIHVLEKTFDDSLLPPLIILLRSEISNFNPDDVYWTELSPRQKKFCDQLIHLERLELEYSELRSPLFHQMVEQQYKVSSKHLDQLNKLEHEMKLLDLKKKNLTDNYFQTSYDSVISSPASPIEELSAISVRKLSVANIENDGNNNSRDFNAQNVPQNVQGSNFGSNVPINNDTNSASASGLASSASGLATMTRPRDPAQTSTVLRHHQNQSIDGVIGCVGAPFNVLQGYPASFHPGFPTNPQMGSHPHQPLVLNNYYLSPQQSSYPQHIFLQQAPQQMAPPRHLYVGANFVPNLPPGFASPAPHFQWSRNT